MIKYWLKIWSINQDLFDDAIQLIQQWYFDFIELYIVPNGFDVDILKKFKSSQIPISFHLPHGAHGFNPIDPINPSEDIWDSLKKYIDYLDPFALVLHPESGNDINILQKRLMTFDDERILIENMPKKSSIIKDMHFFGYSIEQIKKIKKIQNGFCFDFAKAKSSAISQWINIIDFSNQLIEIMNPNYFHISWFLWYTEVDEHFDLWEWDRILISFLRRKLLDFSNKKDIYVVFECKKNNWIMNDLKNLAYFKNIN